MKCFIGCSCLHTATSSGAYRSGYASMDKNDTMKFLDLPLV
jgi:hypothetical protein